MPERFTHYVHMPPTYAAQLINLPELVGNGHQLGVVELSRTWSRVWLSAEALAVLEDFGEHDDGMFDGTSIWIGGTDYEVIEL